MQGWEYKTSETVTGAAKRFESGIGLYAKSGGLGTEIASVVRRYEAPAGGLWRYRPYCQKLKYFVGITGMLNFEANYKERRKMKKTRNVGQCPT